MDTPREQERTPFVGPRPIETGELIFGRKREERDLAALLIAKRIVLLHSPSGAGKSSLVNAALIPALRAKHFQVLPVIRVNRDPAPVDASLLGPDSNRYVLSSLLSLERETDRPVEMATLARLSLSQYLDLREAEFDARDAVLLIFDQFEEILTIDPLDPKAKARFFEQVGDALRNRRRFALFAVREEYVGRLDPYLRPVPTQLSVRMRLDLLSKEAAQQAIQRPGPAGSGEELRLLTDNFTPEAAAELAEDLAQVRVLQPDASPLLEPGLYVEPVQLQVVCERLWGEAQKRGESQVGIDALEGVSTVDDALADYFARKVKIIADQWGVPEWRIRRWFEHKLITAQGIRGLVMRGAGESEGLDNKVIEDLIETYLVRQERRRSITWFELAHDRLIEPVRQNNADWQEAKLIPEQRKANVWDEWGRPEGVFLSGQELANFENWVSDNEKRDPTWQPEPHEANFLLTSRARHKVERRQKISAIAIAVMFFVAVAATIVSVIEADRARQEESRAEVALSTADAALNMVAVSDSRARATSLAAATSESEAAEAEAAAVQLEQTLEAIGTPMTMTLELQQTVEVLQAAATATRAEADRLQGTAEAAKTAEAAANQTAEAEREAVVAPYGLLGTYVQRLGSPDLLTAWKPPVLVSENHEADYWRYVKDASPNTILVGRLYVPPSEQPDWNDPSVDPIQAARDHCVQVLPIARQMGDLYDYWQGLNEPYLRSPEAMGRYAQFEAERARIMGEAGFRVAVGSFATGSPDLAYWEQFLPALQAAQSNNGVLALHEYAWPTMYTDAEWLSLRHRKVYEGDPEQGWAGLPAKLKGLPLIITECGLGAFIDVDASVQFGDVGWKALYSDKPEEYLQQLSWYNSELRKDPYVLGAAVFLCSGDWQWASFEICPDLAEAIIQASRAALPPTTEPLNH